MLKRVLIATDFEDGLGRLGLCRDDIAAGGVEALGFVHAVQWEESGKGRVSGSAATEIATAETKLKHYTQQAQTTQLDAKLIARVGDPADVIRQVVTEFQPELLVLGMPARSLLAEKVFGSTTIGLLPKLSVPVLILRPQFISTLTVAELHVRCQNLFRHLLVPCDLEAGTPVLLERIRAFVKASKNEPRIIQLLHVIDSNARQNAGGDRQSLMANAAAKLDEIAQTLQTQLPEGISVVTEVRYGSPVKEILEEAQESDVTVIATSSRNIGRAWEWTVPSVTGDILRRSWHSILFFPPLMGS